MIPGLGAAEFLRWGSIHRNTYLNFPGCLTAYGSSRRRPDLLFAGQLTGVEGYTESAASGILAGINLDRVLGGEDPVVPPTETMLGGLCRYLREAKPDSFQPMNSNWGLVDPPHRRTRARRRCVERRSPSVPTGASGNGSPMRTSCRLARLSHDARCRPLPRPPEDGTQPVPPHDRGLPRGPPRPGSLHRRLPWPGRLPVERRRPGSDPRLPRGRGPARPRSPHRGAQAVFGPGPLPPPSPRR